MAFVERREKTFGEGPVKRGQLVRQASKVANTSAPASSTKTETNVGKADNTCQQQKRIDTFFFIFLNFLLLFIFYYYYYLG